MSNVKITPTDARQLLRSISNIQTWTDGYPARIGDGADHIIEKLKIIAEQKEYNCKRMPAGWFCSREEGHEGPCAASKVIDNGHCAMPQGHPARCGCEQ
jgi:hypothetical protein